MRRAIVRLWRLWLIRRENRRMRAALSLARWRLIPIEARWAVSALERMIGA